MARAPKDLSRRSIADLRAEIEASQGIPGPSLRRALAADPRKSARDLAARIEQRRARRRTERARLRSLMALERAAARKGHQHVAGVDEVGMGPMAGPIVAAAVILPPEAMLTGVDDSKKLTRSERERLSSLIRESAVAWSLGEASVEEIAELNVYQSGLLAMRRAVEGLATTPSHVLVDARCIPDLSMSQEAHVKGDTKSASIAAASILAKVHRDALMQELGRLHPGYGFENHAGYSTPEHLRALKRLGPCSAHRLSYGALGEHSGTWSAEYYGLRESLARSRGAAGLAAWRRDVSAVLHLLTPEEARKLELLARRKAAKARL